MKTQFTWTFCALLSINSFANCDLEFSTGPLSELLASRDIASMAESSSCTTFNKDEANSLKEKLNLLKKNKLKLSFYNYKKPSRPLLEINVDSVKVATVREGSQKKYQLVVNGNQLLDLSQAYTQSDSWSPNRGTLAEQGHDCLSGAPKEFSVAAAKAHTAAYNIFFTSDEVKEGVGQASKEMNERIMQTIISAAERDGFELDPNTIKIEKKHDEAYISDTKALVFKDVYSVKAILQIGDRKAEVVADYRINFMKTDSTEVIKGKPAEKAVVDQLGFIVKPAVPATPDLLVNYANIDIFGPSSDTAWMTFPGLVLRNKMTQEPVLNVTDSLERKTMKIRE